MKAVVMMCGAVSVLALALATPLQAQTCAPCSYFGGEHWFSAWTCESGSPGCFSCASSPDGHIGCHAPPFAGECGGTVETPGHAERGAIDPLLEEEILAVVADHDAAGLLTVLESHAEGVLNRERSALQIRGCNGSITMHVPLATDLFRSVAALAGSNRRPAPSAPMLNTTSVRP